MPFGQANLSVKHCSLFLPGDSGNWYSSEDEDGGSSVTSILKTLRQQTQAPQKPEGPPSDPRLQKASAVSAPARPADPRLARDPRIARAAESSADSNHPGITPSSAGPPVDPRLARLGAATATGGPTSLSPPTTKAEPPLVYKPPPLVAPAMDEEETERVLRDKPVPIPLDPLMCMSLRDPRSQLQQFSHIKKDVVLSMPAFSKTITWSPEDLLPLPIPKQDFLPLPPGIPPVPTAALRLPRATQSLHTASPHPQPPPLQPAPHLEPPAQSTPSSSSSLPDFELLSRILKTVSSSPTQTPSPPHIPASGASAPVSSASSDKLVDPRVSRKGLSDPRLQPQKSALKQPSEPVQPPASSPPPSGSSPPRIAPYDPRLLSSGAAGRNVGSGSPGGASVLSSISLYDPRTNKPASPSSGGGNSNNSPNSSGSGSESKPSDTPAAKPKSKEPLFVRKSALEQLEPEKSSEQGTDRYNSYNRPRPKPAHSPNSPAQGGAAGATAGGQGPPGAASMDQGPAGVHNLPVSSLFGVVKQASKPGGTGSPFGGNSPVQPDAAMTEQDNASLKDVFKGFDPTASPFCQ